MNETIRYRWAEKFDLGEINCGFNDEIEEIQTEGDYTLEDYLSDNGVLFEEENGVYFVLDDDYNRTGEAFMLCA